MTCNINYDKLLSESYEVYQDLNDDHDHQIDSRHQFNSIGSKTNLNMVEFDIYTKQSFTSTDKSNLNKINSHKCSLIDDQNSNCKESLNDHKSFELMLHNTDIH